MEKITRMSAMDYVLENCEVPTEVREKLVTIRDSFARKATTERKPAKEQIENDRLRAVLVDFMQSEEQYTITDFIKGIEGFEEFSSQKVSGLLSPLVKSGVVARVKGEKNKTYFRKA